MTLDDLVRNATLQGNVRVYRWDYDEDKRAEVMEFESASDMMLADLGKHQYRHVAYIFADNDGFLNVEVRDY